MIETTLGTLFNAAPAMRRMADLHLQSPQARYDLRKLFKLADVELQQFEIDRVALVDELGQPIGVQKNSRQLNEVKTTSPNWQAYIERVNELAAVTVVLECSRPRITLPTDFPMSVNEENALQSLVQFSEESDGR